MENASHWLEDLGSKTPSPWGSPRMTAPGRSVAQADDFLCGIDIRAQLHTAPAGVGYSWDSQGNLPSFPGLLRAASHASSASTQEFDAGAAATQGASSLPDAESTVPDASPPLAAVSTDIVRAAQFGDDIEGRPLRICGARSSGPSAAAARKRDSQVGEIDRIDSEIAQARAQLEDQRSKIQSLQQEHEEAERDQRREWEELMAKRHADHRKRTEQAIKMQRHLRGWLVRRRFILSIHKQTTEHINWAALLPTHLELHLAQLQDMLHKLRYTDFHYLEASLKLQAWWRGTLVRRIYGLMKLRLGLIRQYSNMEKAATKVQARLRGKMTHLQWRGEICLALAKKWHEQQVAMNVGLKCVIKIQKNFRTKLNQRRYAEKRLLDEQRMLDNALMRTSRRTAAEFPDDLSRQLGPPRRDLALQEVEREGLTPFYWKDSSHPIVARHRIGGPLALEIQEPFAAAVDATDDEGGNVLDTSNVSGKLPNVYLSGFSANFVEGLDDDVWPRDSWDRGRPSRNETAAELDKRRSKAREKAHQVAWRQRPGPLPTAAKRRSSRRTCAAPIFHTAQRAHRERAMRTAEPEVASIQEVTLLPAHPLFVNVPALPPPPGRPSPAAHLRHVEKASTEECSWPAARRLSPLPLQQTLPLSSVMA